MKMKCGCANSSQQRLMNYERYNKLPTLAELGVEIEEKYDGSENEEELVFHNEDNTYQTVVVVHKLRASDLCQILAMKNRVRKDCHWSIVEHWVDISLERVVEDHEDILQVYKHMESYPKPIVKKFIFRKDFRKYEVFTDPQKFFPSEMVDLSGFPGTTAEDTTSPESLQAMVEESEGCPTMCGQVWVRNANTLLWAKAYLLLKERKLYLSYKVQVIANFLRHWNDSGIEPMMYDNDAQLRFREEQSDWNQLKLFARVADSSVYTTLNAKKELRAPTEFGICIRTTDTESEPSFIGDVTFDLRCIACETERSRSCWIAAMRLAKYGKQLRENYRAFKSKHSLNENNSPVFSGYGSSEYSKHSVPSESIRSRVAMDFTGSVGRIVEDPAEAQAIAESEAKILYRKLRPNANLIPDRIDTTVGIHTIQPWFHSKLTRDQATMLINKHGCVDGVFLVRESRSNPGIYVLTFKCSGKVIHSQIQPIMDSVRDTLCYSLDSGVTKFYDLLQLIEFYQLNAGCLPTRLTHYLVYNGPRNGSAQQQYRSTNGNPVTVNAPRNQISAVAH